MASNAPPRLTGPAADAERARRYNDPLVDRALIEEGDRYRVYKVALVTGTDLTVRHDLRGGALIPFVQPVGVGNTVDVVEIAVGRAVLRLTAGTSADCLVRFERLTSPQP